MMSILWDVVVRDPGSHGEKPQECREWDLFRAEVLVIQKAPCPWTEDGPQPTRIRTLELSGIPFGHVSLETPHPSSKKKKKRYIVCNRAELDVQVRFGSMDTARP